MLSFSVNTSMDARQCGNDRPRFGLVEVS
jgi:hypothetical protein